jgi:hypothetical protein
MATPRSQLLEGDGEPYFGRARCYDPSLTSAIKHAIKRVFVYAYCIFQTTFVFELQWTLLICWFWFWPRQETGLYASEHNMKIKIFHTRPEPTN